MNELRNALGNPLACLICGAPLQHRVGRRPKYCKDIECQRAATRARAECGSRYADEDEHQAHLQKRREAYRRQRSA